MRAPSVVDVRADADLMALGLASLAEPAQRPVKVIIDTDAGSDVDDALALLMAAHIPASSSSRVRLPFGPSAANFCLERGGAIVLVVSISSSSASVSAVCVCSASHVRFPSLEIDTSVELLLFGCGGGGAVWLVLRGGAEKEAVWENLLLKRLESLALPVGGVLAWVVLASGLQLGCGALSFSKSTLGCSAKDAGWLG